MDRVIYKQVGKIELKLDLFRPAHQTTGLRSAIVFFYGGGWAKGRLETFHPHCRYFADRGMLAAAAEYRVRDQHGTTPFECVADGRSALRWLRSHATELGIDPHRVAAGGSSAGGHVAACAALIADEDQQVSARPDALILYNPAVDPTAANLVDRFEGRAAELSPLQHVHAGAPPTIIFHGTADQIVPVASVERFAQLMTAAGNRCELLTFPGKAHGFHHFGTNNNQPYTELIAIADRFLTELGFLQ